jgi:hypothetical protein
MSQQQYTVYPAGNYEYVDASSLRPVREPHYTTHVWAPASTERTPRSTSPPSSSGSGSGHRRRRSGVYMDGDTLIISGTSPSRRGRDRERERERERRRRDRAAEAEAVVAAIGASTPIAMPRSSTMPTGHTFSPTYETRGRRPIIHVDHHGEGASSAPVPIGVDVIEHASSRSSRHRSGRDRHHHYDRHGSPLGYTSAEEEQDRRRAHRRSNYGTTVSQLPSSAPAAGGHEALYGSSYDSSSYGGSTASGFTPPPTTSAGASPAVEQATKTLRWADEERARQNSRIAARPKLGRSSSVRNPPMEREIKSILKNGGSGNNTPVLGTTPPSRSSSRPPSSESRRRSRRDSYVEGDLATAVSGLGISGNDRERDREYRDRLANRFVPRPPRRYDTFGPGDAQRTHSWYGGAGYP